MMIQFSYFLELLAHGGRRQGENFKIVIIICTLLGRTLPSCIWALLQGAMDSCSKEG